MVTAQGIEPVLKTLILYFSITYKGKNNLLDH